MVNVNDDILQNRLSNIQDTINAIESIARVVSEYDFNDETEADHGRLIESVRDLTISLNAQTAAVEAQIDAL